jgi:ABC-type nickel/cobalt efflux system permease component RcnA
MSVRKLEKLFLALAALVILTVGFSQTGRADTVASLLGNFTTNQFAGIKINKRHVRVHFVVVLGQLPALRELHVADTNGDGVTTEAERNAYVKRLAPSFAKKLKLSVDGERMPLHAVSWTSSLPSEAAGFSLRLDATFAGTLPANVQSGAHRLQFDNTNYAGRIGWHEIVVKPAAGISVYRTNAFSTSATQGLSVNPKTLPPGGPLDERAVHLTFIDGPLPADAKPLRSRPGHPLSASARARKKVAQPSSTQPMFGGVAWMNRATKRLVHLISGQQLKPEIALLALLAALVLGALHAFSPGHGKTVVGAYLIGSRGTPRHAAFLGLTVTITHTAGVFALGFATLFASQFIVPERLFPILSLISGSLVLGIGLTLFVRRWRGASHGHVHAGHHHHDSAPVAEPALVAAGDGAGVSLNAAYHTHEDPHVHDHRRSAHEHTHHHFSAAAHVHDSHHEHEHHHHHEQTHQHDHDHSRGHALVHSHGGRVHSHLPPGADGAPIKWRSLIALGVSGGLIPCPSAMVLLLAAVALHKTLYGLILVLAFSVGLAITLTAVGLAFLYARRFFRTPARDSRLVRLLPMASAAIISGVGVVICYGAVASTGLTF